MYTRLAFAVAAHLEPEILVVDEVLAVGDAAFQKKCLGKMGEVAKHGRTVLFVSHNMAAVQSLCTRAVLLEQGRVTAQGDVQPVVETYLKAAMAVGSTSLAERTDRGGDGSVRLTALHIEGADHDGPIRTGSRIRFTVEYQSDKPLVYPGIYITLCDMTGVGLFRFDNDQVGGLPHQLPAKGTLTCVTDPINLTAGRCFVNVALAKGGLLADFVDYATYLDIEVADVYGSGKVPTRDRVLCTLPHTWSVV
jgi:lipopolysaccharide transport system ATP-binding protein